ncbi:MAG: hypothetical protein J6S83_11090 [Lachnospiraceae bacterium]|nr:hypothetical protein [Lachnospiraceae bacterium]
MKKLICLLCVLVLFPVVSFAEYPLSSNEQNYVGAWTMYADNGKGTIYAFMLTFLDSMEVVQISLTFKDGTLYSNNKASGEWCGFTDRTIIFSLASTDMSAMIRDDGYLYLYFFDDLSLCGVFSRCEDMTSKLGW